MIAAAPADIWRFILARAAERVDSVIVTLTDIDGTSPRAIGAQMAVAADGRYAGSLSGGCIEAAVVAEAISTLQAGKARLVRFGAGSPYIDIRLPCGSGIDLLFSPAPDIEAVRCVLALHERREIAILEMSDRGMRAASDGSLSTGWHADAFRLCTPPALRLLALGQGEELAALARLGDHFGAEIAAVSPDRRIVDTLAFEGIDARELKTPSDWPDVDIDRWTATIFLFHDRDWEQQTLLRALESPAFFVGAIGSRRTQQIRRQGLAEAALPAESWSRLRPSVGLIGSTRDPATLALSILADVVQAYRTLPIAADQAAVVRVGTMR